MDRRMSWILAVIILTFTLNCQPLEATGWRRHLPFYFVEGGVYCDTCSLNHFSDHSYFISGALVALECNGTNSQPGFRKEVKTNKYGRFTVIIRRINKSETCAIRLISSSEEYCDVPSNTSSSYALHLNPHTRSISTRFLSFRPELQPNICNPDSKKLITSKSQKTGPALPSSPPQNPAPSQFRHINNFAQFTPIEAAMPRLPPLPQFPPLPTLPGFPFPNPLQQIISSIFPPVLPQPQPRPFLPVTPPFLPIQAISPPPPPPPEQIPPFPFQPAPSLPEDDPIDISSISTKENP